MRFSCLQWLKCLRSPLRTALFAALLYLFAPASAQAQAQAPAQATTAAPYLFASIPAGSASQVAAFSVDSSGALTAVPGSPFAESHEGGFVAVDPLNQFVFVLNATSSLISVFAIDPATGKLAELISAGSPFAAPAPQSGGSPPAQPTAMATFKTANGNEYLYVTYRNGPEALTGAIEEFQIGTASQPLSPIATTTTEGTPVSIAVSPQGYLYAGIQVVLGSGAAPPSPTPGVAVFVIDPDSGQLRPSAFANSNLAEDFVTLNPAGTFLFDGSGSSSVSMVESAQIQSDGSAAPPAFIKLGSSSQPNSMLVDGAGHFLYVRQGAQTVVYSIDQISGALVTPSVSVPQFSLNPGTTVADPIEPYLYSLQSGQLQVFHVDPNSGSLTQVGPTVDVADGGGSGGLAMTNSAAPTIAGLNAGFSPPALNFPDTPITQHSPAELIHLTNTGSEALDVTLSSIAISGADANDFALAQSCTTPLQPRATCTISIVFTPTVAALRQATLTVTDTAGTQTAMLSGTGLAAQPGVNLAPSTVTFAVTQIDTAAAPQSVVLANTGDANLHISSILVSGSNSPDFTVASSPSSPGAPAGCATATVYPPNASCSITIAFTPLGAGARSASIIIADDAPGSTQTVLLSGTGSGAPVPRPAATLSATSLSFLSPAVGQSTSQQSVIVTSAGNAPLTISSAKITGPNSSDFLLTNGCTASSYSSPNGCTLSVAFTPSSSGSRIATLVINDNDPSSPQSVSLSGETQSVSLTITPSLDGLQQTITAGQSATFRFTVVSTFDGTVTFSACSGAPAGATCSVQPASIPVSTGQVPITLTVTIATVAASTARFELFDRRIVAPLAIAQIFFAFASALIFLLRRRTSRFSSSPFAPSFSASFATVAILALVIFTLPGCGGASTVETAATVTPTPQSQTYTITVTPKAVTSDNLPVPNVQPIQMTLVVN
jgi:6-phosphogluconolactonase (cycloisomerase 2 family)